MKLLLVGLAGFVMGFLLAAGYTEIKQREAEQAQSQLEFMQELAGQMTLNMPAKQDD